MSLEDMQHYYTYEGSLTTPMCYESVRWVVFREKMGLSKRQVNTSLIDHFHSDSLFFFQFDQLRQLKHTCAGDHSHDANIQENFRPVMPLNGRIVYRSFN